MNQLLDPDLDDHRIAQPEHELTLGTGTILGIFFALSLVCAAFFGLGYVFGRHTQSVDDIASASVPLPASTPIATSARKPGAGETALPDSTSTEPQRLIPATVTLPTPPAPAAVKTVSAAVREPATPAPSATSGTASAPLPPAATNGAYMVQIAAVSSQQIADIEVTALKKFGYNVLIRHEPQDQLLHIQLGPYLTHKDAEAIRANVESHGFNAIIK